MCKSCCQLNAAVAIRVSLNEVTAGIIIEGETDRRIAPYDGAPRNDVGETDRRVAPYDGAPCNDVGETDRRVAPYDGVPRNDSAERFPRGL